ncbi:GntR family transcriptional regulator [uncultured Jatrophihabitans sp.]|uniref:GntR family transcriptional regulator n=1 Tax=uncultured Jatrophihabitans sp. TaxID=1610747 RepID=UPI0035CCA577
MITTRDRSPASEKLDTVAMPSGRLLFGALPTLSIPSAVAGRLRAAIGLGFLTEGDRLPREADLVQQLGVTAFALREALGMLREDGLIVTRAGKNGGSFVSRAPGEEAMVSEQLRQLSTTELRDLGDWRQMLAAESASLAARRGSASSVERLNRYAAALDSAETVLAARRAHGRFHIELAAAAQSIRMSRAEFTMFEQFDWLLSLALADPARRNASAKELRDIVASIKRRSPRAARAAAERHSTSTVSALVGLRLSAIAARVVADGAGQAAPTTSIADEVASAVDMIMSRLRAIVDAAGRAMTHSFDAQSLRLQVSRSAMAGLIDGPVELHGIGFIAEPGVIPGHKYFLACWRQSEDGAVPDDSHVTDPERDDFYDYPSQDFFTVPRAGGTGVAQGPYVDYGGVNDYIVTFSLPVLVEGRFVGIAVADLPVATLEHRLAPWLAGKTRETVVVNAEGRVVVSNSATYIVGDVLASTTGFQTQELPVLDWRVLLGEDN